MRRTTVGVVVAVAAAGGLVAWRLRVLRRRVAAEEARGLLMDAVSSRDLDGFRERLADAMAQQEASEVDEAVLAEAVAVVDAEFARCVVTERRNDNGGGET